MSVIRRQEYLFIMFVGMSLALAFHGTVSAPALTTPQPRPYPTPFPSPFPLKTASQSATLLPIESPKKNKFTAHIHNNITKKMTGYHRMGTWYPEFTLTANGIPCLYDKPCAIPCPEGIVHLVFSYDFKPMGKSYRKGTEELHYALKSPHEVLQVAFSWQHRPRLIVETESDKKVEGSLIRS